LHSFKTGHEGNQAKPQILSSVVGFPLNKSPWSQI
jgi:hypothetical protein